MNETVIPRPGREGDFTKASDAQPAVCTCSYDARGRTSLDQCPACRAHNETVRRGYDKVWTNAVLHTPAHKLQGPK